MLLRNPRVSMDEVGPLPVLDHSEPLERVHNVLERSKEQPRKGCTNREIPHTMKYSSKTFGANTAMF